MLPWAYTPAKMLEKSSIKTRIKTCQIEVSAPGIVASVFLKGKTQAEDLWCLGPVGAPCVHGPLLRGRVV